MRKFLPLILTSLFLAIVVFLNIAVSTLAQQNDICNQDPSKIPDNQLSTCIVQLDNAMNQSKTATAGVQKQINGIKARVSQIEADIPIKEQQISDGEKKLSNLMKVLNATIRKFYIESQGNCPICELILSSSLSNLAEIQAYRQININQDEEFIKNAVILINELETEKQNLQAEKDNLAAVKVKLDKVVADSLAYQATLSSQIASLSQAQQQRLAQRLSALGIPLFASAAGACSSDLTNGKSAGFSGGFGLFTYGVPNRVGLSQYGAFGRAKDRQNYTQILSAYYNYDSIATVDTSKQISVQGYSSYPLEDYVKQIYEVPNSWGDQGGMEALKAQAIAVRSYALAYTNNGQGSICATDQCQVFQPSDKGGNWDTAVDATKGMVMMQGGNPIKAWFSSTHGGYIHSSGDIGWDSTSWTKNAQDTSGNVASF